MLTTKNIFIGIAAVLISAPAFAVDTPNDLAGATKITADKAKELIGAKAKIYDVRVATEYVEEHIPGAISVPYKENSKKEAGFDASQDKFDLSKIDSDKNVSIIFQCNGPECWKSYKASAMAVKSGYKNIYWFRGGLPEWKQKGFATEK